jgi:hypothetical protein
MGSEPGKALPGHDDSFLFGARKRTPLRCGRTAQARAVTTKHKAVYIFIRFEEWTHDLRCPNEVGAYAQPPKD